MWQEHGAHSMEKRCQMREEDILAHHEIEPLSHEIVREIDKIVESVKKDL